MFNIHCDGEMTAHFFQPLLFEMLRSFTMLAKHLNLSRAVSEINSTRQTVRRHIDQLEELKGGPLFYLKDRQYQLTDLGRSVLPEAQDLVARAEGWATGKSSLVNGLQRLEHLQDDGWFLYQQQHPLGKLFQSKHPMLRNVLQAWAASGGELEHESMNAVRADVMVFRRINDEWLCVEIGENSSFMSWFGRATAQSSIGRSMDLFPGGDGFGHLLRLAYLEVETTGGVRLDHTLTRVARVEGGDPVTLSFQRLLAAARFPDGSFAMISAVVRSYDVELQGVDDTTRMGMPEELLM